MYLLHTVHVCRLGKYLVVLTKHWKLGSDLHQGRAETGTGFRCAGLRIRVQHPPGRRSRLLSRRKWIYINSDRFRKQADGLEDWFPHISPDGKKMVYIGYPAGTPTHNPRNVSVELNLVAIEHDKVSDSQKELVGATGGQGTMNVNSWAPDSMRFAYVTYEVLP
jgi:hypothetical protein